MSLEAVFDFQGVFVAKEHNGDDDVRKRKGNLKVFKNSGHQATRLQLHRIHRFTYHIASMGRTVVIYMSRLIMVNVLGKYTVRPRDAMGT